MLNSPDVLLLKYPLPDPDAERARLLEITERERAMGSGPFSGALAFLNPEDNPRKRTGYRFLFLGFDRYILTESGALARIKQDGDSLAPVRGVSTIVFEFVFGPTVHYYRAEFIGGRVHAITRIDPKARAEAA